MNAMVDVFHANGWIRDKWPLLGWAYLTGQSQNLKAGEYHFYPGISIKNVLRLITDGHAKFRQITFVEGHTLNQVLRQLREAEFIIDWDSPKELRHALGLGQYDNIEGLIFPDTYHYHRNMRATELLRHSHARLNTILAEEWSMRAPGLPYQSPYEALILASIVEKETALKEEQPRVAGVLMRRLIKKMRLAADPTVIYGIGDKYKGNIRRRHLNDASNSYNTYKHHGLPPTPIALVGRSSLHATLHPTDEQALYFVARGDGSHVFSKTLEEHEHWVREYQLNR